MGIDTLKNRGRVGRGESRIYWQEEVMLKTRICDSCANMAQDEVGGDGDELEFYEEVCLMLGADLPDHCCDQVENGVRCDCPCHPGKRTPARE